MIARLSAIPLAFLLTLSSLTALAADRAEADLGDTRVLAGEDVGLTGSPGGSAFLAGGRARIDGRVAGDAVVTGGVVEIRGEIEEDVIAAGGDVGIDAIVGGDVHAAGGTVSIERDAQVTGRALLAGGSVNVNGRVGKRLRVYGGSVRLDGEFGGDVDVAAEDIQVGPQARIKGRLRYRGPNRPRIDDGAVIEGGVHHGRYDWQDFDTGGTVARAVAGVLRTFWFIGVLVLGALLVLAMPRFSQEAAATVRQEAPTSLLLGFGVLVLVPLIAIVLCVTIIGIPLALATLFGYGLLLMLGYLTGALCLGDWALGRAKPAMAAAGGWRILFLLLALIAIALARRVPWVGELAVFLLFLAGLGAFTLRSFRGYRAAGA